MSCMTTQACCEAADRFYGVAFEAPLFLLTERVLGLEDPRQIYLARHVLTHLFFLLGGFCCYLLALRLSGDRLVALLVMLLFLLSPRLYAHSFFNSKDAAFASAFVMALLFASRAFDKDSVGAYRGCGTAAGLLVNLRIMGVVLVAVVLVFRAWAWFRAEGPAARRRVAATLGVFALWGVVVLFISLPYLWGDPAGRLAEMVAVSVNHPTCRSPRIVPGRDGFQRGVALGLCVALVRHQPAARDPVVGAVGPRGLGPCHWRRRQTRRGRQAGRALGGCRVALRRPARGLLCVAPGCLCAVAAQCLRWLAAFLFPARALLPAGDLRPDGGAPATGSGVAKTMARRRAGRADRGRDWARRRWRWRRSIPTNISISTSWRTGRPRSGYATRYTMDYYPHDDCGKVTNTC